MILALHVEDVEVGPTVVVHVDDRRVAAPARVEEPHPARDVLEPVAPQVVVEDARLGALGMRVTVERVGQADVIASRSLGVAGVDAHVRHEEVEQPVAIVVEEHRAR